MHVLKVPANLPNQAMALKECRWGPEGPPRVRDAYGNVRIVEINCHEQLASLHDQDGIVGFFGSGVWEEHGLHRIYLEYGGRDDLNALIRAHNSYIWRSEDDVAESGKAIPPVIIWNIFQALAAALCLFQSGSLPGNQRQGGYRSLVHLDIKPANGCSHILIEYHAVKILRLHLVFLASRRSASPWPTVRTMVS